MIPGNTGRPGTAYTSTAGFSPLQREQRVAAKTPGSLARFIRSQKTLTSGVSSGLRRHARPYPLFFQSGHGPSLIDVDGNSYIDYTLAWGPLVLGHTPKAVVEAIVEQARRGFTYGAQHDLEYEVAERLTSLIPCADQVCFANSGTEIVQVALRLARAATGRNRYVKFEGHYHGWDDTVLVSYHPAAGQPSGHGFHPIPVGEGQLPNQSALVVPWNDRGAVEAVFAEHGQEISAIICEPILCNSGCIMPLPGFLEFLREVTLRHGTVLIFDEVITGFRLGLEGAQGYFGVVPDLATYAKAIGAGTPLSVLAGRDRYMDLIADGRVVHAGTLNGNPLCLAAAKAALDYLAADGGAAYEKMNRNGGRLRAGLDEIFQDAELPIVISGANSVFHLAFATEPASNYRELLRADAQSYSDFAISILDEGVMVLPDGRWYISTAHDEKTIDATLAAVERALGRKEIG